MFSASVNVIKLTKKIARTACSTTFMFTEDIHVHNVNPVC